MCIDVQSRQMLWKKMKHVPLLVVPINWVFKHILISAVMLREAGRVAGELSPQAVMLSYPNKDEGIMLSLHRDNKVWIFKNSSRLSSISPTSVMLWPFYEPGQTEAAKATVQTFSPEIPRAVAAEASQATQGQDDGLYSMKCAQPERV